MSDGRRGFFRRLLAGGAGLAAAQAQPQSALGQHVRLSPEVRPRAELSIAEAIELRYNGRESRFLECRSRPDAGRIQGGRTRRHHTHMVHDCRQQRHASERTDPARILGRQH